MVVVWLKTGSNFDAAEDPAVEDPAVEDPAVEDPAVPCHGFFLSCKANARVKLAQRRGTARSLPN